jgi:hypothetical protein
MSTFQIAIVLTGLVSVWVALCYIDKKFGFNFVAWFNGECDNPFSSKDGFSFDAKSEIQRANKAVPSQAKDEEIAALKERIQVLEKIVSEPSYELNQKINSL